MGVNLQTYQRMTISAFHKSYRGDKGAKTGDYSNNRFVIAARDRDSLASQGLRTESLEGARKSSGVIVWDQGVPLLYVSAAQTKYRRLWTEIFAKQLGIEASSELLKTLDADHVFSKAAALEREKEGAGGHLILLNMTERAANQGFADAEKRFTERDLGVDGLKRANGLDHAKATGVAPPDIRNPESVIQKAGEIAVQLHRIPGSEKELYIASGIQSYREQKQADQTAYAVNSGQISFGDKKGD